MRAPWKRWTEAEIALLRQHWPNHGKTCTPLFPGRDYNTIRAKARSIGLRCEIERGIRKDGLGTRMVQFFENNPTEELTYADAAVKFDAPIENIYARVHDHRLRRMGIEVVHVIRMKREAV